MNAILPLVLAVLSSNIGAATAATRDTNGTAVSDTNARPYAFVTKVRAREGDAIAWASATHEDHDWQLRHPEEVNPQRRIVWIRAHVTLPSGLDARTEPVGVYVAAAASWEAYWNGVFVGRNGVPAATAAAEVPGKIDAHAFIPPELIRDGQNVLALRMSSFHIGRTLRAPIQGIAVERHGYLTSRGMGMHPITAAVAGALLLGSVYFAVMFLLDRKDWASLQLSLLALAVLGQFLAEFARRFIAYAYPWHTLRVDLILAFAVATSLLLVAYVTRQHFPRWMKAVVAATAIAVALVVAATPGYDQKTTLTLFVGLLIPLALSVAAACLKRSGAVGPIAAIAGVLAVLVLDAARFLDQGYYAAVTVLLLFLFVRQAWMLRVAQRQSSAAELRAVQLELEVLKQRIRPHFLMNTLTALSEWIESEPKVAVKMIDALAAEFRAIAALGGRSVVPMEQELDLCRQHLAVMGFRRNQQFELRTERVDEEVCVPPAIFHTLLENALTHNRYTSGAAFTLEEQVDGNKRIYRLRSPLVGCARGAVQIGTGHAYVRARLRNAFGDKWRFLSEPALDEEWVDLIEVPRARSCA